MCSSWLFSILMFWVLKDINTEVTTDNIEKIKKDLNLNEEDDKILRKYIQIAFLNETFSGHRGVAERETLFLCDKSGGNPFHPKYNIKFTLNLDATFKYIDYIRPTAN